VLPASGSALVHVAPGRALLTYVSPKGGICLIRADGTHAIRLSRRWKQIWAPSWSPRGRYVAFERFAGYDSNRDATTKINVADARGRMRWAFGGGSTNRNALWAPDGRHIAYFGAYAHAGGLAAARPNGTYDRGIAGCIGYPVAFCPSAPTWSADAERLAYVDRFDLESPVSVFSSRFDGTDRRVLVANADWPAYSPRGAKIAYEGPNGSALRGSLFVADAEGRNPQSLTAPSADVIAWPTWSPDARLIAFERTVCTTTCAPAAELVVVPADGAGSESVVATGVRADMRPAWSPDGRLLAFLRGRSIVVASADGSGERIVVSRVAAPGHVPSAPAWRPPVALPLAKRPACPH